MLVTTLSTGVWHASRSTKLIPERLARVANVTGYVALGIAVAHGMNRLIADLQSLL